MRLEKQFEQAMASIEANKEIAREQADVLAAALSKTNIEIVVVMATLIPSLKHCLGKLLMALWIKAVCQRER